jgi:peptidoglycan/xylan/chitin deacetylase (PgdA/CDA1 family)
MNALKRVTLTFDNGPHHKVTPEVLKSLARHDVPAAFMFVGENLVSNTGQNLVRQVHEAGHRVGNHTFSHRMPFGAMERQDEAIAEIERTQELLGSWADQDRLFRPTGSGGGKLDELLLSRTAYQHLQDGGYTVVLWNSIPGDWMNPTGWVDLALADIQRLDWPLIVIHDLATGAMDHLDSFIVRAKDMGAEFTDALPDDCVPLRCGNAQWDPEKWMTER